MSDASKLMSDLNHEQRNLFQQRQVILSFDGFLQKLKEEPRLLTRDSASYIHDVFSHFGSEQSEKAVDSPRRWKLFDCGTERNIPIIGSENVQDEIYKVLTNFIRQGFSNKLVVLHGPNGSAKTSIIESISHAMQRYSEKEEGSVYRFNWIFPTEKSGTAQAMREAGPIGFSGGRSDDTAHTGTFAFLDEAKIASKIHSEFKENPIFRGPGLAGCLRGGARRLRRRAPTAGDGQWGIARERAGTRARS